MTIEFTKDELQKIFKLEIKSNPIWRMSRYTAYTTRIKQSLNWCMYHKLLTYLIVGEPDERAVVYVMFSSEKVIAKIKVYRFGGFDAEMCNYISKAFEKSYLADKFDITVYRKTDIA